LIDLSKLATSGLRKDTVLEAAREFAIGFLGFDRVPTISRDLAQKLGILNIPGLELDHFRPTSRKPTSKKPLIPVVEKNRLGQAFRGGKQ
jgi:hypothetical protein